MGKFVVMGANGGIGEALALRLSSAGHDVIATMRDMTASSSVLGGANIACRQVDVTNPSSIEAAFSDIDALSGFAYCIGSIDLKPLKAANDADYLRAYEVNVLGALRALKLLEPALKQGKGSVVLFSSIAVQQGFGNHTVISTAKGAIEGLTKALAAEWAGQVRVNCIAPSLTDTGIAKPLTSSAPMREAIEKMHPIARLGTADDSANMSAFLLGDEAGWMTGQIVHIDGGRSTLRPRG